MISPDHPSSDSSKAARLLKQVRDGIVTHRSQVMPPTTPDGLTQVFQFGVREFGLDQLVEAGMVIEDGEGNLAVAPQLSRIQSVLGISLTELSTADSRVSVKPQFGVPRGRRDSAQVFVVMPFSAEMDAVYRVHIRNVIRSLDLTVSRADDFFDPTVVMKDVWEAIFHAKLVIADCTGRNPNVFYEIGIAHTLGRPTILIAQKEEDISFNVQHLRYVLYSTSETGIRELETRLHTAIQAALYPRGPARKPRSEAEAPGPRPPWGHP